MSEDGRAVTLDMLIEPDAGASLGQHRCERRLADFTRANMRFVPTKTLEQQSCLMLHRTRHLFIRQQTAVINAIRAHLAEFGIVAPVGRNGVEQLLDVVADASDNRLPEIARACLLALGAQLRTLKVQILLEAPISPTPLDHSQSRSSVLDRL
jgi:transposase